MIKLIDEFLDHTTMYRLVLLYLVALLAVAFVLGFFGLVPHQPAAIVFSTSVIVAVCWIFNRVFAAVFRVPANAESVYITALILALILNPVVATDISGVGVLVFASVWAMASKYLFASNGRHVFNPAALAALLAGIFLGSPATWWVAGNLSLLPAVLLGGILIVRKLRCYDLVGAFLLAIAAATVATTPFDQLGSVLVETVKSSPLLFFAFVMLTEPLTAPATRIPRILFAGLVGVLFVPSVHLGWFYFTPELALLIGNFLAYLLNSDARVALTLDRIEQTAADTYDFVFHAQRRLVFQPGQYLEWTLGLQRADNRGNRRYFTVASSPTEEAVRLGVKFYPRASAFKQGLAAMTPGDTIHASRVSGQFTLPADPSTKLAFIAGGIGITPFRSMLQFLVDHNEARPVVMLYAVATPTEIAYRNVIDAARDNLGIPTFFAVEHGAEPGQYEGRIDADLVRRAIPDYRDRVFYISGPQAMVAALRRLLTEMGVRAIKVDYFPGFA